MNFENIGRKICILCVESLGGEGKVGAVHFTDDCNTVQKYFGDTNLLYRMALECKPA